MSTALRDHEANTPANPDRSVLLRGGSVLHSTDTDQAPTRADVLIIDGVITEVGNIPQAPAGVPVRDVTGKLLMPGMINAHYHSHDTLAKGTLEEEPLEYWRLLALPPQFPKRSRAEVKARTLIGAYECLRAGITTVQDMVTLFPFDPEHLDAVIEAYEEIGLRAVVGLQYADRKGISTIPFWEEIFPAELHSQLSTAAEPDSDIDQLSYLEDAHLRNDPRELITWALGPSAPERCSPELLARTSDLAQRYDLQIFSHFYESKGMALQARMEYPQYGGSLVRRLAAENVLGPRLNLAHSVWLLQDEIEMLAESGTGVVLNPLSNLKLKSGIPPVQAMFDAGLRVAIGCDNSSCSDAQNLFQAMKLLAMLGHISDINPGPAKASAVLSAATTGGAAALGRTDIGQIAPGSRGDITVIDLSDPSYVPANNTVRQLVYTESGRGVRDVIVEGRVVIDDGRLTTIDPDRLRAQVEDVMPAFTRDRLAVSQRIDTYRGYLAQAHERIWAQDVGTNRLFTGS